MSKDSVLKQKSMAFAKRIVRLYQFFTREKQEFVMSKQILRSGTSIGANITEEFMAAVAGTLSQSYKLQKRKPLRRCIGLIC